MKELLWLLPLLAGCEQYTVEHQQASQPTIRQPQVSPLGPPKPAVAYTSGDRTTTGPLDTLHVGRHLVLRLVPGSESDFPPPPRQTLAFSEARLIQQQGDGRVHRVGYTLIVRPFTGPVLRFADDTYQMRKDANEDTDTKCTFLGSMPGRPYWIADSLQYERYQPFLINKHSGRATLLSWDAEVSPNRNLLFVASPGLDIESSLNGLELLAISDHKVKLLWTKTLRNWQPHQARWLNDHTIAIKQVRFEPKEDTTYVRLILPN